MCGSPPCTWRSPPTAGSRRSSRAGQRAASPAWASGPRGAPRGSVLARRAAVKRRWRTGDLRLDPDADVAGVQPLPFAVRSYPLKHRVDEPHQVLGTLRHAESLRLKGEPRPDDLRLRILGLQTRQDGVRGRDRGDLSLLEHGQAV